MAIQIKYTSMIFTRETTCPLGQHYQSRLKYRCYGKASTVYSVSDRNFLYLAVDPQNTYQQCND